MRRVARAFAVALALGPAHAELPSLETSNARSIALPNGLKEVSGLAVAQDGRVFAHNDEFAIVYEVELASGEVVRAFALGDPTVSGDFEGVAIDDGRVYLLTSKGLIFEAEIGEHRTRVKYNIYDTGAGERCELEGLANGARPGDFLLLCKEALEAPRAGRLVVFKWSLAERSPVSEPWISMPAKALVGDDDPALFRPSAIERRVRDGAIIVISARDRRIIELSEDGEFVSRSKLDAARHAQAEGVALLPDGTLVIADEGPGRRSGALTLYPPAD